MTDSFFYLTYCAAIGYAPSAVQADFHGKTPYELCPEIVTEVQKALAYIEMC